MNKIIKNKEIHPEAGILTLGEMLKVNVEISVLSAFVEDDATYKILLDAFYFKYFLFFRLFY